jgi:tetratricopeptide (TPR) repeat protein
MAERIAPRQPPVLAARGYYAMLIDQDYPAALAAYTAAEEAGLADPIWILPKADALLSLGRRDEAMQTIERALRLDPRNTFLIIYYSELLQGSRRVRDALQTLELGIERVPDAQDLQRQRNYLLFMNTGDQAALDALTSLAGPLPPPDSKSFEDNGARLATLSASLRFNHRLVELQQWLARYPTERLRSRYLAVGEEPIARLRGWADLLVSDRVAAAKAGRAVLAFLQSTPETRLNKAFRRLLAAEAYTFIGDSSGAVAAVREAEQLRPWAHYAPGFGPVFGESVAAVYAWNGAHDQAVALLGNLATEISGPGPGEITRDPIYTMPLADDAGFKALVSKLEAQMRALKIELSHVAASSPNPPESRDDARNFERRRDRPIR